ncbi:MAG: integrase [Rhodospirillaceae bacterium]|nr:MAG: integrase [Rhodospirillaceae bacterium]
MGWIHKRERKKGTVYRAVVRMKGFPQQQKTFSRLTDAKMWVQQTEVAIRKGEFHNVVKAAAGNTLTMVIERYRRDILPHRAASTRRAAQTYLNYWDEALGKYALAYIEPEMINKKLDELEKAGDTRRKPVKGGGKPKPKSRRTIKHYRDMLAALLNQAQTWGWTAQNPMDGVNKITKIRNDRTRYLSDDERTALLEACQGSDNDQLYAIVAFALSTGSRKGEALGLTMDDLDLERGLAIFRNTKNGDTRSVPVVGHLKEVLIEHVEKINARYKTMKPKPPKRWVFPRLDGQLPIDIRKAWENARDAAELVDFRFHDLRHSTASYLAMNGASQLEIAEVLGHRTLQMVKRYAHLSESHVKSLMEDVNKKMF